MVAVSLVLLSAGIRPHPASAAVGARVTGSSCAGSTDILSWAPPAVTGLTGYHISGQEEVFPSHTLTWDLPPDQTSLKFPAQFGGLAFNIYAVTSGNVAGTPFDGAFAPGIRAPQPMQWDTHSDGLNVIGDGSVRVAFFWGIESANSLSGGSANDVVTVTASPGGASIKSKPSYDPASPGLAVVDTFTGLTDGVHYTFTAVAINECGSSGPSGVSAPLTPTGPEPGALTCFVANTQPPTATNPAQQSVQVQAADGLAAVSNVSVVNGTVAVASFTKGTTAPVMVTATKADPGQRTSWSFDIADSNGQTRHCN